MKNAKLFWPTGQTTVFFQIYIILYFSCIGFNKWIRFSVQWVQKQQTCWWQRNSGGNQEDLVLDLLVMDSSGRRELGRREHPADQRYWWTGGIACSSCLDHLPESGRWPDLLKTTVRRVWKQIWDLQPHTASGCSSVIPICLTGKTLFFRK